MTDQSSPRAALYREHGELVGHMFDGTGMTPEQETRLAAVRAILDAIEMQDMGKALQPSPYGDHRPTELEAERAAHAATRQRLVELRRIVVDYMASCYSSDAAVTRAGFAAFGKASREWLEQEPKGAASAALLANPDTLRDLHRRTQAAEAEVHALRRQLEHAQRQWNEAVADRNRYNTWARRSYDRREALSRAIRVHLDASDRCDPSAEHATRQALDALLTETPRPDGAE